MPGFGCASGLDCEPGTQVCRSRAPAGLRQACGPARQCARGLSCQPLVQRCYHSPRHEGEPCGPGFECVDGLYCEAGSQVCRTPAEFGEACGPGRPCGEGLSCPPALKCVAGEIDLASSARCDSLKIPELAQTARDAGDTMAYSFGSASALGGAASMEAGTAYGENGEYGCFVTSCTGVGLDASISEYSTLGLYDEWSSFEGFSIVVQEGVSTPFIKVGPAFTTGQVLDLDGNLVGGVNSLGVTLGVSPIPVSLGSLFCYTLVLPGDVSLRDLGDAVADVVAQAEAGGAERSEPSELIPTFVSGGEQLFLVGPDFPDISPHWDRGLSIDQVAYGGGQWAVVMQVREDDPWQRYLLRSSFPRDEIKELWDDGRLITNVTHGGGQWVVVATEQPSHLWQRYSFREEFPKEPISEAWDDGLNIQTLDYADGEWILVVREVAAEFHSETWHTRGEFPRAEIEEAWDDGALISSLRYENGLWVLVTRKHPDSHFQKYWWSETFPAAEMAAAVREGLLVTDMTHDGDRWLIVATREVATPFAGDF